MEDEDDDFFTFKAPLPPPTVTSRSPDQLKSLPKRKKNSDDKKRKRAELTANQRASEAAKKSKAPEIDILEVSSSDTESGPKAGKQPARATRSPNVRPLTPPPQMDPVARAEYMRIVRENLFAADTRTTYAAQLVEDAAEDDVSALDPELAAIQAELASRPAGEAYATETSPLNPIIRLDIQMVANPNIVRTSANERGLAVYERVLRFEIRLRDTFEQAFAVIAARSGIGHSNRLILTYQDRRIFPAATPASLGMFREAAVCGYKDVDYEAVLESRKRTQRPKDSLVNGADNDDTESNTSPKKVQLTLRGAGGRSYIIAALPSATWRSVLDAYLHEFSQINQRSSARLEFDGEKINLNSTIADESEIEDEDILDVIL